MKAILWAFLIRLGILFLHGVSLAIVGLAMSLSGVKSQSISTNLVNIFTLMILYEGWILYAWLRYRTGRRDEVRHVITTAIKSQVPLHHALDLYRIERPTQPLTMFGQLLFVMLIFPLAPGAILVWWWVYSRRFDHLVQSFARDLEDGKPLSEAVRDHPGVLSKEARLAIRVSLLSGQPAEALERANARDQAASWLELVPRLVYPFIVLTVVMSITTFLFVVIIPRYKKIYSEFRLQLPSTTKLLIDTYVDWEWVSVLPTLGLVTVILVSFWATMSSVCCWYVPIFGSYYRREQRGRLCRMLGLLLSNGLTVPRTLEFLAESEEVPGILRGRLEHALDVVDAGDSLPDALLEARVLTRSATGLLASAQRAGNLPWTLQHLGDYESRAALISAQRWTSFIGPMMIMGISVLVAWISLAMFLPLVQLMEALLPP